MPWSFLADLVLVAHMLIAAFAVLPLPIIFWGAWRGWQWVRHFGFRMTHLCLVVFVSLQALMGELCPLTHWEAALRERAEDPFYEGSFVAHWLSRLLYVDLSLESLAIIYSLFAALVAASWFLIRPRRKSKRKERIR
ncbi:MAG: DUF2784 domain-containing protein [Bradymonadales bacterium]|nr:MAG: DUF2784 domain-containing protein [Bradymonadales bacterium]